MEFPCYFWFSPVFLPSNDQNREHQDRKYLGTTAVNMFQRSSFAQKSNDMKNLFIFCLLLELRRVRTCFVVLF